MLDHKSLLLTAINAAILAGAEVEKIYENGFSVELKADNSPVTEADLAADAIIREQLVSTDLFVLSEEVAQEKYEDRKHRTDYWCVDPIDGTRGFVERNGEFCVCIALIINRRAYAGVIYQPIEKRLYYGMKDFGAYKANPTGTVTSFDQLQSVTMPSVLEHSHFIMLSTSYHMNTRTASYIQEVQDKNPESEVKRIGSALKYCLLADGEAHHYPRFGQMCDWDIAPGQAILEAAGGSLVPMLPSNELLYNSENLYLENFFCWQGKSSF